jgi:phosphoribosylformylglycinamidine synthase
MTAVETQEEEVEEVMVYRVYVEKKQAFAAEAAGVLSDLNTALNLNLKAVRIVNRYDAEDISEADFAKSKNVVFSEPPADEIFDSLPPVESGEHRFASEYLPGQFDQRADSAAQCISMLCGCERPIIKYTKIYRIFGDISAEDFSRIKKYLINAVESRETDGEKTHDTLRIKYEIPQSVKTLTGFTGMTREQLSDFVKTYALAMDLDDAEFCRDYFRQEQRDPTMTEIRLIDTYWSDHCRHTTFGTVLENVTIDSDYIAETFEHYKAHRNAKKNLCLMDLATSAVKQLKAAGKIPDLDESEEINACSVKVAVDVDGMSENWLLMFKNETHNHPTEIEPFGGAATCLGGAIRDPLSGRSYVYQAMRITGSSDPLLPVENTRPGKLPPRKITATAAAGYSSYGNQIGLATGLVDEIYDPGYMAKRMEIGAVIGAAPAANVIRERPKPGDIILLLGGKTGRDGCGGATGSSKAHNSDSLETSGAEVQKGNAPEERKIQRLFRSKEAARLIKRCNDFGAGGVAVAVGELADGLVINLNALPKKYDGLDGTELAISESQERMAVVIAPENAARFAKLAGEENIEVTGIAAVTAEARLRMCWNDKVIVDISREFLNSNGAKKYADAYIPAPKIEYPGSELTTEAHWIKFAGDLRFCSRKGLIQRFDSTVGAATVLMPFGGAYQQTPEQVMAAKLPVTGDDTQTVSLMSWGYNPEIAKQSPYHGAAAAVIESVAKIVAGGGKYETIRLSFQEYFGKVTGAGNRPERWGLPLSALLGAYDAQQKLGIPAIGGKDSMSGSFEELDVPPTLVSFAVTTVELPYVMSAAFKAAGHVITLISPKIDEKTKLPDYGSLKNVFAKVNEQIAGGNAVAAWALSAGGEAQALFNMAIGSKIGAKLNRKLKTAVLPGAFVLETINRVEIPGGEITAEVLGETIDRFELQFGDGIINIAKLQFAWESTLEPVFRSKTPTLYTPEIFTCGDRPKRRYCGAEWHSDNLLSANENDVITTTAAKPRPRVLIPVFPGTNGEYDMAEAFRRGGAIPQIFVVKNLTASAVAETIDAFAAAVRSAQIIALPGGFSAGDEPEGSGKFINAFFISSKVNAAVSELLNERDGLMLGICNGFQALIKLGLLPYGKITPMTENSPTLTFNTIGRHQSQLVHTRLCSVKSPWLLRCEAGDVYTVPISHGEGRFAADEKTVAELAQNGQILSQYADINGTPSMDIEYNPNGSVQAVEGLLSPDGRVLGKMGHSERVCPGFALNVPGRKYMPIFESAVDYFL